MGDKELYKGNAVSMASFLLISRWISSDGFEIKKPREEEYNRLVKEVFPQKNKEILKTPLVFLKSSKW